jgi:HEAT repeat protein
LCILHARGIMLLKHLLLPLVLTAMAVCQAPPANAPASSPVAPSTAALPTETQARDIVERAVKDKNPDTRKQAATALSLGGPREPFISQLESMLDDKDVEVRLAVVSSLADLKAKPTLAALRKALNDDVPEVGFAAAKALYGLNDAAGKEALLSVLSGETKVASGFITKQKRDAIRMMHTPRIMMMFALKQGIGFAPVPGLGEGISSMQGILSDPGVSGRALAALLLGREKDVATLQALREGLMDKDASVRAAAVHSLALRNDPVLQPDLVPLLDDRKESVRLRAATGYLRLQMIRKARRPATKTQGAEPN